jgi:hypothetical protein
MATLISKPGITNASVLTIPTTWGGTWFRSFVNNQLTGADVRNAIAGAGITISGNLSTPYATISAGGSGNPTFTGDVTITGATGAGVPLTVGPGPGGTEESELILGTSTQSKGYLGFENVTTSTYLGGIGGGDTVTGQGVNDLAIAAINNIIFGAGGGGTNMLQIGSTGAVTISAPTAAVTALAVGGHAGAYAVEIEGSTSVGTAYGMLLLGGSNTSDAALLINNAASTTNYLEVRGDGAFGIFNAPTTAAGAANVEIAVSGFQIFQRFTSSARYKANIASIKIPDIDAILQFRPVTYTSTCAADDPNVTHLGFIAEEMALIDPRLVTYMPATLQLQNKRMAAVGTETIPDAVNYDKITVLLVGAVQALVQRLAALEVKVTSIGSSAPVSIGTLAPAATPAPLTVSLAGQYGLTGINIVPASVQTILPPMEIP